MKQPEGVMSRSAKQRSFLIGKSQVICACLANVSQLAVRRSMAFLMGLAILGAVQTPAWSAGVTDIIWLESNSTAGNSILAFKNDGSGWFAGDFAAPAVRALARRFARRAPR